MGWGGDTPPGLESCVCVEICGLSVHPPSARRQEERTVVTIEANFYGATGILLTLGWSI